MQTHYTSTRKKGLAGQKSDSSFSDVSTRLGPKEALPFGSLVVYGDEEMSCMLPVKKEDVESWALGVALHDGPGDAYKPGAVISVLRQGRVFVRAEGDVDKDGAPAFVQLRTGKFSAKKGADTVELKGACFMSQATKGEIVELELDLIGGAR